MDSLFLTDNSLQKIQSITAAAGTKKFAVAFWGQGAAEQLGISKANGIECQILCDLFSGACNPKEMHKLLSLGCEIKTIDGLHSKIYCNADQVLIGSSNASSNGLASNTKQFSGNVEANALVTERPFVDAVHKWFDEHWSLPSTQSVTTTLVEESKPIWLTNSAMTRQLTNGLLSEIRQHPGFAQKLKARVIFYVFDKGSASAERAYNLQGRARYSDAELRFFADVLPYYEDRGGWNVHPGDVFLDFECSKPKGRATFYGIWRVRKDPFIFVGRSKEHRIILLDKLTDIDGLRVTGQDRKKMEQAIDRYMKSDPKHWEADQYGDFLDVSFADFWRKVMPRPSE